MKKNSYKSRVLQLKPDQRGVGNCGICGRVTRILCADLDTGLSSGRCCAGHLQWVDEFLYRTAPRMGWDHRSTWHHPDLAAREQFAINYRSNKPYHG